MIVLHRFFRDGSNNVTDFLSLVKPFFRIISCGCHARETLCLAALPQPNPLQSAPLSATLGMAAAGAFRCAVAEKSYYRIFQNWLIAFSGRA